MFVKPWCKEAENYFKRLAKDRIAYVDDIKFTRNLGHKYPELFDEINGFMDIGRIDKRRKSMIALRPGNVIVPIKENDCRRRKFTPFKLFKI